MLINEKDKYIKCLNVSFLLMEIILIFSDFSLDLVKRKSLNFDTNLEGKNHMHHVF